MTTAARGALAIAICLMIALTFFFLGAAACG
jgi:hypothetical protein